MGWLGGWQYRKSHVINSASGAGTNYQVRIVAHYGSGTDSGADVYLNSHCRTDFGDVRFTDYDGETLLDYWMEMKVDGDYAVFWVEVADDLSSSNATIYIYYGKSDATTTSNGTNTFILFDNFDGTDIDFNKWSLIGDTGISYSVSSSLLKFWKPSTGSLQRNLSHNLTEISNNYMFEARCRTESDDTTYKYKLGVEISNENLVPASASNLVYMAINRWQSSENWNWRCEKKVNGVWSNVANSGSETITTNWRVFGIARIGTTFYAFKDYQQKASTTIGTITNNYVMLYNWLDTVSSDKYNTYDWARVRKYVSPEPSHGAWGSEETPSGATYNRAAGQDVSITGSVSRINNVQRSLALNLQFLGTATKTATFMRQVTQMESLQATVVRLKIFTRTLAQPLNLLASPSRTLTFVRQPFQTVTLASQLTRIATMLRTFTQVFPIQAVVSRQTASTRALTQAFTLTTVATRSLIAPRLPEVVALVTSSVSRILTVSRRNSAAILTQFLTTRTLSIQRQAVQSFSINSLASRLASLSRTQPQKIMLTIQAGRTQTFARLASTAISTQTSATRWQQAIRQATSQIQMLISAFGEKKGFYERLLQLTITVSSSATRIIQLQRFNTQTLTITAIVTSFKTSSRTATSNIMLLLETVTQKISFGVQRTADLSITVNAVAQRTRVSMTRTANALFQAIVSVNRWVLPLYEGIPSGPITTPHFEITVESFTYSLNVFQNNLETKTLIKFEPLNSFDGNVTINYWITNTAETETFASKNITIPIHASDRDPTQYTLTLNTPIFWTAVTNDHLIWHMNAQYNGVTTGESRVLFTPIPWLTMAKPFTPYFLLCLGLVAIYIIFFKSD